MESIIRIYYTIYFFLSQGYCENFFAKIAGFFPFFIKIYKNLKAQPFVALFFRFIR